MAACKPLGPRTTSNSTACPSLRDRYPSDIIAEKWTKTSSPVWRWMNPKPLLALNHFTVPCSFNAILTLFNRLSGASISENLVGTGASFADSPDTAVKRAGNKKRPRAEACDLLKQKAVQKQQTHRKNSRNQEKVKEKALGAWVQRSRVLSMRLRNRDRD